jgi:hypothetical protein
MMVMRPKHVVWRKSQTIKWCVRLIYSYHKNILFAFKSCEVMLLFTICVPFLLKFVTCIKIIKFCITNVVFLLLVLLCCFVFVSLCVVDGYCDLSLVFVFVFVFYCIFVFQICLLYFVSYSNECFLHTMFLFPISAF